MMRNFHKVYPVSQSGQFRNYKIDDLSALRSLMHGAANARIEPIVTDFDVSHGRGYLWVIERLTGHLLLNKIVFMSASNNTD